MSNKHKKDWTLQHHDGVSELTMIGRPVKPRTAAHAEHLHESITQVHTLEVSAWVDDKRVGHAMETQDAHYPDDGIPYVYDGKAAIVKALRGLADKIEASSP